MTVANGDVSLRRLELRRAIRNGELVRARLATSLDVAVETLAPYDEAWRKAVAEKQAAGAALQAAMQEANRGGRWVPIDFDHFGQPGHDDGDVRPSTSRSIGVGRPPASGSRS